VRDPCARGAGDRDLRGRVQRVVRTERHDDSREKRNPVPIVVRACDGETFAKFSRVRARTRDCVKKKGLLLAGPGSEGHYTRQIRDITRHLPLAGTQRGTRKGRDSNPRKTGDVNTQARAPAYLALNWQQGNENSLPVMCKLQLLKWLPSYAARRVLCTQMLGYQRTCAGYLPSAVFTRIHSIQSFDVTINDRKTGLPF
jgi:hypothetical protein